jgi:NodT family efflux transporter outer membrane factor (OMF) lipoprotein
MKRRAAAPVLLTGVLLCGCNLAPVYTSPSFVLPESYQGQGPFEVADPNAILAARGGWWAVFNDAALNQLEDQLAEANPSLNAAVEQYTQARDLAAEAQSDLYPHLGSGGELSDNRQSVNRLFRGSETTPNVQASNEVLASASWEPDFWDALRNRAHQQKRLAQASAADLATVRLSLEAQLAADYLAVRGLDREVDVLTRSISAYEQAVNVTHLRYHGGIGSGLDLARASSQLATAQAQQTEDRLQRDLLQHAIAVLVGVLPSTFTLPPAITLDPVPPDLPVGVPSALLQRRPDIASAERRMAAANAAIGVARAAFYPNVTFFGNAGLQDRGWNLVSLPNSLWSIGSDIMLPLFEGGLRRAELQQSWSVYAQTRDDYRATVLAAFQEVEDALSLVRRLQTEVAQQHEASEKAAEALSIATTLYHSGLDNYLSVSVAQVAQLAARTSELEGQVRQMRATVSLIRALGGGWTDEGLPSERETLPFGPLDYGRADSIDPRP